MKNFKDNAPKDFALVIVGKSGSGKSTLAGRFPKPHYLSLDHNLRGPCAQLAREGITDITYEDQIDRGDNGEELPPAVQFAKFNEALKAALQSDRETIVIDNATALTDLLCAEVLRLSPTRSGRMEIPSWGSLAQFYKQIVLKLRQAPKRVIIICLEKTDKDELDGSIKNFLAIPGQTSDLLPSYVTDVWRTEVHEQTTAQGVVTRRMIRVVSNARHEYIKTSLPALPATFEASQKEIEKVLAQI